MTISKQEVLNKVYTADNHDDLMDAYKLWAEDYDADVVGKFGYVAHIVSSQALQKYLEDKEARILDAGCGTGLVGVVLQEMGYTNIDALDYSQEMLDEAEKKGVYKKYIQADLCKALDFVDNAYGAIICVGTFTYGHVGPDCFKELIRVTKPGGYIVFTIREGAYEEHDYTSAMPALEEQGLWELVEMRTMDYLQKENVTCKVCVYKVL
jgi:predicted TPR repeat methyltransferase